MMLIWFVRYLALCLIAVVMLIVGFALILNPLAIEDLGGVRIFGLGLVGIGLLLLSHLLDFQAVGGRSE